MKKFNIILYVTMFIILFGFAHSSFSANTEYGDLENVKLIRVYDGDSITVNIPSVHPIIGKSVGVRLAHIDTPELSGKCAKEKELAYKAKDAVLQMVPPDKVITLRHIRRDMYFRILADVEMGGIDVGTKLIELGLARLYEGSTKKSWCDD